AIVNDRDEVVGSATKREAWEQGLTHRIVRIMLENSKGEILLQHRSPTKDIFPDCWDNSAAGHVDTGEDYDEAAVRELKEELGITGIELRALGQYRSDETWKGHRFNQFNRCYKATIETLPRELEAGKVDDVRWFTVEEVKKLVAEQPDTVTDGLRQVIEHFY
ncbi:MAG: NUDIX domain-containing protein, partial [Patescibacteria group bacterium]